MATLDDLSVALRNADAAGDADSARVLAAEITKMRNTQPQPSTVVDMAKSAGVGVGKGLIGVAGLPGDLAEYGARGIDWATRKIGGALGVDVQPREDRAPTYGSADITKAVEEQTGPFYKPQTTAGKYAETVGEFAPGLIGGPAGLVRRGITQVLAPGLASEAAGQATEGTKAEPYARIAGALAGGLAPSAIGRAITPVPANASRQRLVETLQGEGVTSLTAGQRTGSEALRYAESVLGNAPLSGQRASRLAREGQEQFTEAALRRAGTAGEATPEVLAANQQRLSDQFRDLSARNTLVMDRQFAHDVGNAVDSYQRVPPSQQRAIVEGYANDIVMHAQQGGVMPGTFYQEMRSRLSKQSNSLRNSDPTLSEALRDLRNALDNAMRRSISPADRQAWDTARQQWGAQKVINKAASRAGEATAEGQLVPANLRNTVAAENRDAYATGRGPFNELARAGAGIMGQMPQSGTAPRAAIHALASLAGGAGGYSQGGWEGALAGAAGGLAGPALLGRALMSRPAQAYLRNQVAEPMLRNLNPRQAALISALMAAEQQRLPAPQ